MREPELSVLDDAAAVAEAAAEWVVGAVRDAVAERSRCLLVLAGGRTPRALYEQIATPGRRDRLPWAHVEVFFGDERCVPPEDEASNYRMARESLLAHLPVPAAAVHRIPGELQPFLAARRYEEAIRHATSEAWPSFDVVLLGLGEDGHTASLFPGSPALEERDRLAVAVQGPTPPRDRVTLTLPLLNTAREVAFLVAGGAKADALARVLRPASDVERLPAARVRPPQGRVRFFVDRAAADRL